VYQGTILGPILFLIIIESLDELDLDAIVACFADDTTVCKRVKSIEDTQDFQCDIEKLYQWEADNNMKFNISKF